MEYTEQQKAAFKELFSLRRKRQIVMAIPLVVLIIAFSVLADKKAESVLGVPIAVAGPAFVVIVLGMLVFSFRNWRCPACDCYLGKGISPRFCPKCGVALQ